mgnify:CR=1 FL=1
MTILNYTSSIAALPTSRNVQDFTATAAQTTFTVTAGYIVGLIDVFVNGSKLTASEFTATNGTTFVLTVASTVGDQVQSINYTASVNGISGAGTANYVPKFTASGTIGNSSIQDSGSALTFGLASTFSSSLTVVGSITFTPSSFLVGSSTATDGNSLTLQSATSNYYVRFRASDGSDQGGLYQRTLGSPIKINNGFEVATLVGSGNRAVYSNATGELTNSSSDFTLKTNIVPITYGLNTILKLNPITYNWINTEDLGIQKEIGFIAQEVEIEIPELIGKNSNGKLSLDYPKMVAILTKAIQEQTQIIEDLKTRIVTLESK